MREINSYLRRFAEPHDLADEEGRAQFRSDVRKAHEGTKLSALNEWAGKKYKARQDALNDLTEGYIKTHREAKKAGGSVW